MEGVKDRPQSAARTLNALYGQAPQCQRLTNYPPWHQQEARRAEKAEGGRRSISFSIFYLRFSICYLSLFSVCHFPFVIFRLSFSICHLSFAIDLLLVFSNA